MNLSSKSNFKLITIRLCYFTIGLVILSLFVENFVFSESLGILRFREIDDVAFQYTLRSIHLGKRFLTINDYAYGWIFWAPMAFITYPFYLLSKFFSIDWPLVVIPRQVSLIFSAASLFYLRKILLLKKAPEWLCALALLIFTLFPTFGYFSLRFGTVNAVMFFSLLTFYLALKDEPSTFGGRKKIILSLAVAGGIKLSGLLIAPIIFAIVLIHYRMEDLKSSAKHMAKCVLFFLFVLIVFTNPMLLFSPFRLEIAKEYWHTLSHFIAVTKLSSDTLIPLDRFYLGVCGDVFNLGALIILYFGILIYAVKNKSDAFLKYVLLVGIVAIAALLMYSIQSGSSLGSYFTSVSFLIVLGVLGLHLSRMRVMLLVCVVMLLMSNLVYRAYNSYYFNTDQWQHFSYYIKSKKYVKDLEYSKLLNECLGLESGSSSIKHILIDFTVKSTISSLAYPKMCVSVVWSNLSELSKYCATPADYLVLDAQSVGFLAQSDFEAKIAQVDQKVAEDYKIDRRTRQNLILKGTFDNQTYQLACQLGEIRVYKRIKLDTDL